MTGCDEQITKVYPRNLSIRWLKTSLLACMAEQPTFHPQKTWMSVLLVFIACNARLLYAILDIVKATEYVLCFWMMLPAFMYSHLCGEYDNAKEIGEA